MQHSRAMNTKRAAPSMATRRPAVRVAAVAAGAGPKQLTGPCVVRIQSRQQAGVPVTRTPESLLPIYMTLLADRIGNLELPLGGRLVRDGSGFMVTVPKIQIFDIWMQPMGAASLEILSDRLLIKANEAVISGSHHVTDLKLQDKFNLDVSVVATWKVPAASAPSNVRPEINIDGSFIVDVDVPAPFSFMPKPVLETTGSAAIAATLALFLNTFVGAISRDYDQWLRSGCPR